MRRCTDAQMQKRAWRSCPLTLSLSPLSRSLALHASADDLDPRGRTLKPLLPRHTTHAADTHTADARVCCKHSLKAHTHTHTHTHTHAQAQKTPLRRERCAKTLTADERAHDEIGIGFQRLLVCALVAAHHRPSHSRKHGRVRDPPCMHAGGAHRIMALAVSWQTRLCILTFIPTPEQVPTPLRESPHVLRGSIKGEGARQAPGL